MSALSDQAPVGIAAFADLPAEVETLVSRSLVAMQLEFGRTIFEQGDPPDAVYFVQGGVARVVVEGDDGQEVSLNMLRAGDTFGATALLAGTPRSATVRASSEMTVLRLDGALFRALAGTYPALATTFGAAARETQLSDFLRVHSAFGVLDRDAVLGLAARLQEIELADGEAATRVGDPSDALYLVRDGRLGVWISDDGGPPRRVRIVHSGQFFGELGLLRREPRSATVTAEGTAQLLRLDESDFYRLMEQYPAFAERVRERSSLYESRDRAASIEEADERRAWTTTDPGFAVSDDGALEVDGPSAMPRRRRFPVVRQIDQMDCGAASLAMVCRAFGHDVSMATIRHAVDTGIDGTSLRGLIQGGEEVGLRMRGIKSSTDRLDSLALPAILHWEGNHWVVLYRVDGDQVRIADPGRGLRKVERAEVEAMWSGYAALAQPTEELANAPRGGLDLSWIWPFFRPHRRALLITLLLALVAAGLEMVMPVFSQLIIDHVLVHHNEGLLYIIAGAMVALLLLATGVTILQRFLLARVAATLDADTLNFLSGRLFRLPMRYFAARRTGDIERRLSGMQQIRAVLVSSGIAAVTAATQFLVALVIMVVYSWELALLFLLCAPMYAGLMRFSQQRLRPVFDGVEAGYGRYQSTQIDAIRGIETVKASGTEDGIQRKMATEFGRLREKIFRADLLSMIYEGMTSVVSFLIYAVFLFFGALEVLHHHLTLGQLVAFSSLVVLANGPLLVILGLWDRLQMVTVLMGRLQDVLEQEPEQGRDQEKLQPVPALHGEIRLRRTGFAYGRTDDRPILQDISLEVAPGTTVGIVGRSGSGKSTLARCLAGLLVPTSGTIEFDGVDMRMLQFRDLRRQVGFVLQAPYLFDDTIEANIAFGVPEPELDQVRRAAEIADAAEFIERLPLAYKTRIGDSGLRLSGGQAQRIAIARALFHEPAVLIFDEATSALDTESERAVKRNMDRVLEGRTAFVIAHRLSTIRDADVICVLDQGKLVEHGTHEELVRREGLYAYLQAQQLEG